MRHNRSRSCLPRRNSVNLGCICGSNIDTGDVNFTSEKNNLVYMDKVFSFNDETSCPFLFRINTGGPNSHQFKTELTYGDERCCNTYPLDRNAEFNVERAFVAVDYFGLINPNDICRSNVTVDGYCVDSVQYSNGQYLAATADLMDDIQQDRCMECGLASKGFFLVNEIGPWEFKASFILEGTVNQRGRTTPFRCKITSRKSAPNIPLPTCSLSSFAVSQLALPCSINGIAPDLKFQFSANVELVNPELCLGHRRPKRNDCGCGRPDCHICGGFGGGFGGGFDDCGCGGGCDCGCGCDDRDYDYGLTLVGNVAIEPTIHVEVVRQTLFCVNACEGLQPCDGSVNYAESVADEDCKDPFADDCACGTGSVLSTCQETAGVNTGGGSGCGSGSGCGCSSKGGCGDVYDSADCGCDDVIDYDRPVPPIAPAPPRPPRPRPGYQVHGCNGCSW